VWMWQQLGVLALVAVVTGVGHAVWVLRMVDVTASMALVMSLACLCHSGC